jgi:hypothetical protein
MNRAERNLLKACYLHKLDDLEITTADLTLHCDYGMGNDLCGKGTALLPYKTPIRAMQDVAYRIAHKVKIVLGGLVTYPAGSFPRRIDNVLVGDGSLTFYGKGAPTRKATTGGPHTVTGIASTDIAQTITVGGAAWAADEFVGYWARVVTGGHIGRAWPIFGNTTDKIFTKADADGVHNADTVEIIRPSVKVECDDLDILYDVHSAHCSGALSVGSQVSKLTIANLWLDASGSTSGVQLQIHGNRTNINGPILDFVRVDTLGFGVTTADCLVNSAPPFETDYILDSSAAIANMGLWGGAVGSQSAGCGASLVSSDGRFYSQVWHQGDGGGLTNVAVHGGINMAWRSNMFFGAGAGAAWLMALQTSSGYVKAWFDGPGAGYGACDISGGTWFLDVDVRGDCDYAIDVYGGAIVRIHGECTCSPTLCTKSALRIGGMCKVTTDHALAGFLGGTAGQEAYICAMDVAVKAATWPAAGTYVTDAKGGELLRVS